LIKSHRNVCVCPLHDFQPSCPMSWARTKQIFRYGSTPETFFVSFFILRTYFLAEIHALWRGQVCRPRFFPSHMRVGHAKRDIFLNMQIFMIIEMKLKMVPPPTFICPCYSNGRFILALQISCCYIFVL